MLPASAEDMKLNRQEAEQMKTEAKYSLLIMAEKETYSAFHLDMNFMARST